MGAVSAMTRDADGGPFYATQGNHKIIFTKQISLSF